MEKAGRENMPAQDVSIGCVFPLLKGHLLVSFVPASALEHTQVFVYMHVELLESLLLYFLL